MFPKIGSVRNGGISKLGYMQLEAVIQNAPGLFQAWHYFAYFHINLDIGGQGVKVVLVDDFVGGNV